MIWIKASEILAKTAYYTILYDISLDNNVCDTTQTPCYHHTPLHTLRITQLVPSSERRVPETQLTVFSEG